MAIKRYYPKRGVGTRIKGLSASIGKNGHLYLSRDVIEEFGLSREKAAILYWDDETNEILIEFVNREGKERGDLHEAGWLSLSKQGASLQISAQSFLADYNVTVPEKTTRFPVVVKSVKVEDSRPKQTVAAIAVGSLVQLEPA
jgi:hypothetical protein